MKETTFQSLIDAGLLEIGDGYRAKNNELGGAGPIFLRAGHVSDTHISFDGVERFRAELTEAVASKMSRPGDVVITTKGNSTGRTTFVTNDLPAFVYSPHLSYWRSRDVQALAPGFLRAWSNGPEFVEQLDGMKLSTDMAPYLSLTDQRRLRITLPSSGEQQAIARVLGGLDDKIELNRRMNRTLEDLARGLFKSWFVDFDPVTRATGSNTSPPPPGLFPARLVDSPLGPVPEGWQIGPIYEHADVIYGAPFASSKFNTDRRGLPLIRIRDLADHNPEVFTDEIHPKGTRINAGDIVVGMDGEFRAHVWRGPACWLNQRMCQFKPKRGEDAAFVLYAIEPLLAEVERSEVGTTVIHLGKADIDKFKIVLPPRAVMNAYSKIAGPMLNRMVANGVESRSLTSLRDVLLPQLLSGEIRLTATRSRQVVL